MKAFIDQGTDVERLIKYIRYDERMQTQDWPMQLANNAEIEYTKLCAENAELREGLVKISGYWNNYNAKDIAVAVLAKYTKEK